MSYSFYILHYLQVLPEKCCRAGLLPHGWMGTSRTDCLTCHIAQRQVGPLPSNSSESFESSSLNWRHLGGNKVLSRPALNPCCWLGLLCPRHNRYDVLCITRYYGGNGPPVPDCLAGAPQSPMCLIAVKSIRQNDLFHPLLRR